MIKDRNVERTLHSWPLWCKAVDEGRQQTQLIAGNSEKLWSYAGRVLESLQLPTKPLLRLYFLACIFSTYKHGDTYVFSEIEVPPFLRQALRKLEVFPVYLSYLLNEELNKAERRPLPPAIWSRQDIEFRQDSNDKYIMVLPKNHPLRQIGSQMKRGRDPDIAIQCARMTENTTEAEINERFGWKPQKGVYGTRNGKGVAHIKRNRFPTEHSYVRWGRKLIGTHSCPEFLPDSAEQIAHSIDMTGLRAKIDQAFQVAIARSRRHLPTRCPHCGVGGLMWDDEDKVYKCLACARTVARTN